VDSIDTPTFTGDLDEAGRLIASTLDPLPLLELELPVEESGDISGVPKVYGG